MAVISESVWDLVAGGQARYYWLLLAEEHRNRRLFGSNWRMIVGLPLSDG